MRDLAWYCRSGVHGLKIAVPLETAPGEKRVALTPEGVKAIRFRGLEVVVQTSAGERAGFDDDVYRSAGAEFVHNVFSLNEAADLMLRVNPPSPEEASALRQGAIHVSLLFPTSNLAAVRKMADRKSTAFALDLIPRISRAQSMDVLSSMSTIAGYKAALIAADALPKFFPMFMTAAGTLAPARVLVIGAGVAGLQAIATCRRLGAIVEAFDVRPAVKEQVESLGARFVEFKAALDETEDASGYAKEVSQDTHVMELELIASRMVKNDVVITTALIPGRPAPVLITRDMVRHMAKGSVIVDLAATNGGNCEATEAGKTVVADGVTILGPTDLLSQMAFDASKMYSKNMTEFLGLLVKEGALNLDMEDQIIRESLVTHDGKVVHEPTRMKTEREEA